jgi:hypothetical protein
MCSCEQRGKKKRKNAVVNVQTTTATARPLAGSLTAGEKSDVTRKSVPLQVFQKNIWGGNSSQKNKRERLIIFLLHI